MLHGLRTAALVAVPMLVAACGGSGGGDEGYLVESCVSEGNSRSSCECQATVMRRELPDEQYDMLVDIAKLKTAEGLSEEEAQKKLQEKYGLGELMALGLGAMGVMMQAESECE